VRIPSAYTAPRTGKITPEALPVATAAGRPQLQAATDAYNRHAQASSAQVIDAEYVEFYTPSNQVLQQERNTLDNTLEGAAATDAATGKPGNPLTAVVDKYQLSAKKPSPQPGSLLNIYA